jgi:hypothetical protein
MEYCVLKQRETLSSTDIHSKGKKTIFKKFATLLVPFVLASVGSLLTNSAAHARTYWTSWENCNFPSGFFSDYTPWRALIEVRSSDSAARAIKIQYGNGNSEQIRAITIYESRYIKRNNQNLLPDVSITINNQTEWTSPSLSLPWVSNLYHPREVNVVLTNRDNKTCGSFITF